MNRAAVPTPTAGQLRRRERGENFPVALRVLPADLRDDLHAVYAVVRTIDDLGDDAAGDRTAALQAFAAELATVWSTGAPTAPVLARLAPTVARRSLSQDPFERLIRANLRDQQGVRYETFDDLLDYCALSAAPIGRIVLTVLGVSSPERICLSDRVCAGLQVVEHLQDVAEDRARGRLYLPAEDLAAHGVPEEQLDAAAASPALRRLILAELRRVDELLAAGRPLVAGLAGWARLAVAGYVAGGRAAADALRRIDGDVLARQTGARRRDVVHHLPRTWTARRPTGGAAAC